MELEFTPASATVFHYKVSRFTDLMHPSFPDLKSWDLNCSLYCVSTTATTVEFDERCALKVFQKLHVSENLTYIHHEEATQTSYSNECLSFPPVKRKKTSSLKRVILEFNMTVINTIENSKKRTSFVFRTAYGEKDLEPYTAAHQALCPTQWR